MLKKILPFLGALFLPTAALAVSVLLPTQGGTGISNNCTGNTNCLTVTTTDVGKAIIVSSTNPFYYKLGEAGAGATTSSPFTPCAYWSPSSPPSVFGSICLENQVSTIYPSTELAVNGDFEFWSDPNTPMNFATETLPIGDGGTAELSKNITDCLDASSCVQEDFSVPNPNDAVAISLSQSLTYSATNTIGFSVQTKRQSPDLNNGNFTLAVFANYPFGATFFSLPDDLICWQPNSAAYGHPVDVDSCLMPDTATTSSWHVFSSNGNPNLQPTGPASSTMYISLVAAASNDTAPSDQVFFDNLSYGNVTTTVVSGTNQFAFTSPDTDHPFNFKGAIATFDQGITTTAFQLVTTTNVSGYTLQADANGFGSWVTTTNSNFWQPDGSAIYYNNGNVGIGLSDPSQYQTPLVVSGTVGIIGNGNIWFNNPSTNFTIDGNRELSLFARGESSADSDLNYTPIGAQLNLDTNTTTDKFLWYPRMAAIRAGILSGTSSTRWNDGNIGFASAAFTFDSVASGFASFAAGAFANASQTSSIALGNNAVANGLNSVSIGPNSFTSGIGAVAFSQSEATNDYAFSANKDTHATGLYSAAFGQDTTASGSNAFSTGELTSASNDWAAAFNHFSRAEGQNSTAFAGSVMSSTAFSGFGVGGDGAGQYAIVLGEGNTVDGDNSYALGHGCTILAGALNTGCISFGSNTPDSYVFSQSNVLGLMGGNVGIDTTTPPFKLSLDNDGAILALGEVGSGATLATGTIPAAAAHFFWYPRKAALSVGRTAGELTDSDMGDSSTGLSGGLARGNESFAVGDSASANGRFSLAIGPETVTWSDRSIAIGSQSTVSGFDGIGIGDSVTVEGDFSIGIGSGSSATGYQSLGIGTNAFASNTSSAAIGPMRVSGQRSLGIGFGSAFDDPFLVTQDNVFALMGGNVGINTTTPVTRVDVVGTTTLHGDMVQSTGDTFLNTLYGSMYQWNVTTTVSLTPQNSYVTTTGYTAGDLNGISFGSASILTVSSTGEYEVNWNISGNFTNANQIINGTILKNGAEVQMCTEHNSKGNAGDNFGINGGCQIHLVTGDKIALGLSDQDGTGTFTIYHANIRLNRIGR